MVTNILNIDLLIQYKIRVSELDIYNNLTVLILTLNEEKNIKKLIDTIIQLYPGINIIVIDDGSNDNTINIVKMYSAPILLLDRMNEPVKGLSISIKEGISLVKTDYFMVIDGDFQHPPESLLDAYLCSQTEPDLIIGHRVKVESWPIHRKLMSWGAQFLGTVSLFLRRKKIPKDIMSGFFGGNTEKIKSILDNNPIQPNGYKILFDILKSSSKNISISQFGYIFKDREFGTSKIGVKHMKSFIKALF